MKRSRRPCCVCGEPLTLVANHTEIERVRRAVALGLTLKGEVYPQGNNYLHPRCDLRVQAWLSWKVGTSAPGGATG